MRLARLLGIDDNAIADSRIGLGSPNAGTQTLDTDVTGGEHGSSGGLQPRQGMMVRDNSIS